MCNITSIAYQSAQHIKQCTNIILSSKTRHTKHKLLGSKPSSQDINFSGQAWLSKHRLLKSSPTLKYKLLGSTSAHKLISSNHLLSILVRVWFWTFYPLSLGLSPLYQISLMGQCYGEMGSRWARQKVMAPNLPLHLSIDLILLTLSHYE